MITSRDWRLRGIDGILRYILLLYSAICAASYLGKEELDDAVQLASGQLLIAGGSKQVEIYNPATGRFTLASGELSDAWHYMSETRLKDGSVLLAGGYPNNDQATAQAWILRS